MDEEYNNNKIETKAADSSSGSHVPTADNIPMMATTTRSSINVKPELLVIIILITLV